MKIFFIALCLATGLNMISYPSFSQCSMCSANVESNLRDGSGLQMGKGLNTGILYLLSIPYVLGAIGVFVWLRKNKNINASH